MLNCKQERHDLNFWPAVVVMKFSFWQTISLPSILSEPWPSLHKDMHGESGVTINASAILLTRLSSPNDISNMVGEKVIISDNYESVK